MLAHDIDGEKESFLAVLLNAFFGEDFTSTGGITLDGETIPLVMSREEACKGGGGLASLAGQNATWKIAPPLVGVPGPNREKLKVKASIEP